jgi:hypothetical protein
MKQARIKTHTEQYSIRPVVNNLGTPAYKVAKFLSQKLGELMQLPCTYNVINSTQLAYDLVRLNIENQHKCLTLDIKDLCVNIPIKEATDITRSFLIKNNMDINTISQYINLLQTILHQNYFTYEGKHYSNNKGITMGSST